MIENLISLRKNQWIPRREKTVTPKKLKEVHASPQMQRTNSYQSPFMKKLGNSRGKGGQKVTNFRDSPKTPVNPMTRSFSDGHAAVMVDPALVQDLRLRRRGNILNEAQEETMNRSDSRERGFSEWEPGKTFDAKFLTESPIPALPARHGISNSTLTGITEPPSGFAKTMNKMSAAPVMDADLFEKRMASILDEYLASSDELEVGECVSELKADNTLLTSLPTVAVLHVMEKKADDRSKIDQLLLYLCTKGVLNEEQAVGGMTSLMEQMPDLEMDVPMYGKYIAATMSLLIAKSCIKPVALQEIFGDMIGTSHAPKVMLWMLDELVEKHGMEAAQACYDGMLLPGVDFIPGEVKGEEEAKRWLSKTKCRNDLAWVFVHKPTAE